MSNYHFGDDYDLNYYPQEASDSMGGVDWDKVERVEIEFDVYVKERTCRCTTEDAAWCFVCSECGKSFPRNKLHLAHNHGEINYCPNCGARVIGVDE